MTDDAMLNVALAAGFQTLSRVKPSEPPANAHQATIAKRIVPWRKGNLSRLLVALPHELRAQDEPSWVAGASC